jgi:signal transduction histidine kinase
LLTRLVDDLRTLALADAGQLSLDFQPVDLVAIAQGSIEQFTPQAEARQVELRFDPPGQCRSITADSTRLGQILGNLLSNALRYTPTGGRITMAVNCLGERIQLTIHDSGPGISEAVATRFERFTAAIVPESL